MIGEALDVLRCDACHVAFLAPRGHCPRCGSRRLGPATVPAAGVVLAATEITVPPAGTPAPHRLVLLELEEGVRLLAVAERRSPSIGEKLGVRRDGDRFVVES